MNCRGTFCASEACSAGMSESQSVDFRNREILTPKAEFIGVSALLTPFFTINMLQNSRQSCVAKS